MLLGVQHSLMYCMSFELEQEFMVVHIQQFSSISVMCLLHCVTNRTNTLNFYRGQGKI